MAVPTFAFWPEDVPWEAEALSFSEKPQSNKNTFTPDAGAAIESPRVTLANDDISYTSKPMTGDEFDRLMDFWRYTLKQGSLFMQRYHPRKGVVIVAKFTDAPAIVQARGADLLSVSIKLVKVPSVYD